MGNKNKNYDENDTEMYVDIDLDDGKVTCQIVTIFECNGRDYIALLPLDKKGENKDGEVWIYRHNEDKDGNPSLEYIDDTDEYEAASDAFDEYLDNEEFNDIV